MFLEGGVPYKSRAGEPTPHNIHFVKYPEAIEVLIFKGKSEISVTRRFALSQRFYFEFKKMFER